MNTARGGGKPIPPAIGENAEMSDNISDVLTKSFMHPLRPLSMPARSGWDGNGGKRNGEPTKIPVDPTTGRNTDAPKASWSFEDAVRGVLAGRCDGIGISLRNGLVGIDYDHVLDENRDLKPEWSHVMDEIRRVGSYVEVSPSGNGLHILVMCDDIPASWTHTRNKETAQELEFYHQNRYFTVTGELWIHSPNTLSCEK